MIQIEVKLQKIMPLLCKDCNGRRFPIAFPDQRDALWLCENCKNFVNIKDEFVREWTKEEMDENKIKLEVGFIHLCWSLAEQGEKLLSKVFLLMVLL